MDQLQFFVVVISGTGGLLLGMLGCARWGCLVGLPGQGFWLHQTWDGPREFFYVAVAATAAYLVGVWLHWLLPWWRTRGTRGRRSRRTAGWL